MWRACCKLWWAYNLITDITGRTLHHSWGSSGYLHHHGALAGESQILTHPLPSPVLQTWHQTSYPGPRKTEGGLQVSVKHGCSYLGRPTIYKDSKLLRLAWWLSCAVFQCKESSEPVAEGGARVDWTGIWQSSWSSVSNQTSLADSASL